MATTPSPLPFRLPLSVSCHSSSSSSVRPLQHGTNRMYVVHYCQIGHASSCSFIKHLVIFSHQSILNSLLFFIRRTLTPTRYEYAQPWSVPVRPDKSISMDLMPVQYITTTTVQANTFLNHRNVSVSFLSTLLCLAMDKRKGETPGSLINGVFLD